MLFILVLITSVLVGLFLLGLGVVLLFKLRNKLAGALVTLLGLAFILTPFSLFLYQAVTVS